MSTNEPNSTWALTTLGGIPVKVVSRSGFYEAEAAGMTEEYVIRADTLAAFALETFPISDASTGVPAKIRSAFGLSSAITRRISWEANVPGKPVDPFNSDPNPASGTYGEDLKLTIEYSTSNENEETPDPNDPKTWLEISANASGQFLHASARGSEMTWKAKKGEADAEVVKEPNVGQTIIEPEVEWSVRWTQIPWVYFNGTVMNRLRNKLGKVNDDTFTLLYGAPAETVLFLGFSVRQQFTWRTGVGAGKSPIQLEMKFLEKNFISEFDNDGKTSETQVTHNHFYRPGKGYQILYKDGQNKVYAQDNLNEIFSVT